MRHATQIRSTARRSAIALGVWLAILAPHAAAQEEPVDVAEPDPEPAPVPEPEASEPPPDDQEDRSAGGQGDTAAAESLLRAGTSLMDAGRYDEACPKLAQSMEAAPNGEIAMLLGGCLERQGKIASAWAAYRHAVTRLRPTADPALDDAQAAVDRLDPLVPKLTLQCAEQVTGMVVHRNTTQFGAGIFGVPLAVDPGPQTIAVSAKGYETWTTNIDIKPNERLTVTIPPLDEATRAPAPVAPGSTSALFIAGIASAATGAASFAVAGILAALAARDVDQAETDPALCPERVCSPAGRDLVDAADAKAIGASVLFTAGAVLVAAGFALVIADAATEDAPRAALAPQPLPGGGGATLHVRF